MEICVRRGCEALHWTLIGGTLCAWCLAAREAILMGFTARVTFSGDQLILKNLFQFNRPCMPVLHRNILSLRTLSSFVVVQCRSIYGTFLRITFVWIWISRSFPPLPAFATNLGTHETSPFSCFSLRDRHPLTRSPKTELVKPITFLTLGLFLTCVTNAGAASHSRAVLIQY